ncbi:hypothetical protein QJU89_04015 [Pasteurella skyensis]|uniref:Uncharacterized protein n=1 Tax=Phocoenobacter skyensis TaxID=97481 RepID=A0AAJ6P033_9PAST|nr:hypothetical protein [Pasteurella skyensis]MDP8161999.1 hypothetical protein [Pasteurella skyensis]MDP8172155.1 hypothetical protein [Pasteurella skyensis]MDP8176497.1 hypothetical protein [Pasteurella skyensis]MDP8178385.1 hypothetical protein [Pasteurella skyensis]MDP8182859.1 hypothetical protein [Pasteurella skyensis]
MKKENSPTKKPKRKYKKFICIGFIFAFIVKILTLIYKWEIDAFIDDMKDKVYYNFPQSCHLTETQFEKAVWESLGRQLLKLQKWERKEYDACRGWHLCEIWIIDKEITPNILDKQLINFYLSRGYKKYSRAVYLDFLKHLQNKGNIRKYYGGKIDFNKESIIADVIGSLQFKDKKSIKISKDRVVVSYLTTRGSLINSTNKDINYMLFKNAYPGFRDEFKVDSCGRLSDLHK